MRVKHNVSLNNHQNKMTTFRISAWVRVNLDELLQYMSYHLHIRCRNEGADSSVVTAAKPETTVRDCVSTFKSMMFLMRQLLDMFVATNSFSL